MKKRIIIICSVIVLIIASVTVGFLLFKKKDSKVTITFDTNGGKYESAIKIDKGTSANLPEAEREGYVFIGWYTESGETFDSNTVVTTNTKVVAKWIKEEDCPIREGGYSKIVKFDTTGGNTVENITICVTCTPENVILPVPQKDGYTFDGWYADSRLTKKAEGEVNNVKNAVWTKVGCYDQETTLYAKWQKEDDCPARAGGYSKIVKFNTNGGNSIESISICTTCAPEETSLPVPQKDGYYFDGWYADAKLTKKVVDDVSNATNVVWTKVGCYDQETTLYAKWQKEDDCPQRAGGYTKTIKFNTRGGNTIEDISICVTCAPETIVLPTPKRDGATFDGWYADYKLTKKVEGDVNDVKNAVWGKVGCYSQETTLYAKWK